MAGTKNEMKDILLIHKTIKIINYKLTAVVDLHKSF